ncbi:MAG: response regulator MprA [Planctomycetota bacterium]|nr:MAG: response regulator MprA [Planctomycetota bacterium]
MSLQTHPPASDSRARVLVVDDDPLVRRLVVEGLNHDEFTVSAAETLAEARRVLQHQALELIVLDVRLPDGSGLEFASELRRAGSTLPVLMLTVQDRIEDRVAGLERGADDYLCKPFAIAELTARVAALLRRSRGSHPHLLRFLDVELDLVRRAVRRGKLAHELSTRECALLAHLMNHPREILDRRFILQQVWGEVSDEGGNVLNVYINYLRNKLEGGLYPRLIHTIRGVGYILSDTPPDEFPSA